MATPPTQTQLNYVFYAPCYLAPLSAIGSLLTILSIIRTKKEERKTYHRIIFGIASMDVLSSIALSFGPLPIPEELGVPGARGNTQSCTAQSFFLTLGTGSFLYTAMLMWYYVLVITYNTRESIIINKIERWMHIIPIGFYFSIAIAGIALGVFNPAGTFCFINDYPPGCADEPDMECERGGDHIRWYGLWFGTVPFMVWCICILIALSIVACSVMNTYRKTNSLVYTGGATTNSTSEAAVSTEFQQQQSTNTRGNFRNTKRNDNLREVLIQCFMYGACFLNVMVWSTIGTILYLLGVETDTFGKDFFLTALGLFFYPSQGFFLFLIYIRPRYVLVRKNNRDEYFWVIIKEAIWNPSKKYPNTTNYNQSSRNTTTRHRFGNNTNASSRMYPTPTIVSATSNPNVEHSRVESQQPLGDGERNVSILSSVKQNLSQEEVKIIRPGNDDDDNNHIGEIDVYPDDEYSAHT